MSLQERIINITMKMTLRENEHFFRTGHIEYGLLESRYDEINMVMTFYKICLECKQ